MVTGNGMIAKRFSSYKDDDRFLIFASGVSNSKNDIEHEYERESDLLKNTIAGNPDKQLVYFSTCSIYDSSEKQSKYVLHKLEMEKFIQANAASYTIIRASNVVGKSHNPNTVLNYFVNAVRKHKHFNVWTSATRNIIDIDDVYNIVDYVLHRQLYKNKIINVANTQNHLVGDIVRQVEVFFNTKANYSKEERGSNFVIDVSDILPIIKDLNINFADKYLEKVLLKNYPINDLS